MRAFFLTTFFAADELGKSQLNGCTPASLAVRTNFVFRYSTHVPPLVDCFTLGILMRCGGDCKDCFEALFYLGVVI